MWITSRTLCRLLIGSFKSTNSVGNINTAKSLQKKEDNHLLADEKGRKQRDPSSCLVLHIYRFISIIITLYFFDIIFTMQRVFYKAFSHRIYDVLWLKYKNRGIEGAWAICNSAHRAGTLPDFLGSLNR